MLLLKTPSFARIQTLTSIKNPLSASITIDSTIRNTTIPLKNILLKAYNNSKTDRFLGRSLSKYAFSSKS